MTGRQLIVNADDFGLSLGVNHGIIEAHQRGIVTSASLMVREPAAAHAVALAEANPGLALGVHIDLGEWVYLDGEWRARYVVVPTDDAARVEAEVERQVAEFERLSGRPPTHLDSHQHVHHDANVKPALLRIGTRLGAPVRGVTSAIQYNGSFYGQDGRGYPYPQAITVEALVEVIGSLPPGVTELACHPGFDDALETTYRLERADEVRALCDPAVRQALEDNEVTLSSFAAHQLAT